MNGKSKCKILKDIRRQIAAENNIEFVTTDCKYQGDCTGTCPKCESEVRYLEEQLRKRRQAGKAVAVAGIAAALVISASGCVPAQTGGDPLPPPSEYASDPTELTGEMGIPPEYTQPTSTTQEPLMGDPVPDDYWEGEIPADEIEPTEPVDTRLPPYNNNDTMGYIG